MADIMDHPDIAAALCTGYPPRTASGNQDSEEYRDEYLTDHTAEFLSWLKHGDQDVLDRFFEEHAQDYKDWLN